MQATKTMLEMLDVIGDRSDDVQRLLKEIERLQAENAELRKDAERYRWLRNKHNDRSSTIAVTEYESMLEESAGIEGIDLDAAIDAAMKGGE